jgi:predicted acylesterase/phospholipase RssA
LTDEDKQSFLKSIYKNYGRTALCLSGGAGFGYYHLGVVRALLQAGILPTVVTGTSAGALMGKTFCIYEVLIFKYPGSAVSAFYISHD